MRLFSFLLLSACVGLLAADPEVVYLWPHGAPGSEGRTADEVTRLAPPNNERVVSGVHKPSITVYLPARAQATGAGVVIAPGGGHRELWTDHEGHNVAKWLAERGVAAFVLSTGSPARRSPRTRSKAPHSLTPTQALTVVRKHAAEWGLQPEKIGVMGFSAGGELGRLSGSPYD
jgi:endo-1,4-beta-xylanase